MQSHHLVAYFSPAGSTRLVAETIRLRLAHHGHAATMIDLGKRNVPLREKLAPLVGKPCCLWIGSPVYCDHAVPVVSDFLAGLPSGLGGHGVAFVTWGGVTSGLALPELAQQLRAKGFMPVAAAKVLAVHSSLWQSPRPLGMGHPNGGDLALVERMVEAVVNNLANGSVQPLAQSALEYLSPALRADAAGKSLALAKASMPPLAADEQRCSRCGECALACPVAAIVLDPFPRIGAACVVCMQCVRVCPEEAFPYNAQAVAERIAAMAARSDEAKETAVFY